MMGFKIRDVTMEDLPDIYPLYHECLSALNGHCILFKGHEMKPAFNHYLDLQLKHGHFKVAVEESSGTVVGMGGLLKAKFNELIYNEIIQRYGALISPQRLQHITEFLDPFFQKMREFDHKQQDVTSVRSIAVNKDHRGKGIGGLLLDSLVQEARTLGECQVSGVTNAPPMKRAFESAGFHIESAIPVRDDPSFVYGYLDKSLIGTQYADHIYKYTLSLVD